jgi:ketosteroid isomerase-like protein
MTVDLEVVTSANEEFYAAVERGDLDALKQIWVDESTAVCIHPGASPIHGTRNVMRSWALIMANTDYIQFFLTDVEVSVEGDVAAVTCRENILTAADSGPQGFNGGLAEALNVFVRRDGRWRLWLHQAAPVVSEGR